MLTNRQVNEYINKAIIEFTRNRHSEKFEQICTFILENANINQMIVFIKNVEGTNIMPFSKFILNHGTVEQNFEIACIQGSDSRAHREMIINSQNIQYNLLAGKVIKDEYCDEYINRHGDIVIKGSAYQNYKYLKNNKSKALDKQRHFDVIINSKSLHINHICAKDIAGADVLAHGRVIINSKDVITNMAFARIRGADIKSHLDVVLQYGSANDNFDALKEFDSCCEMHKHIYNIFASSDNQTKYNCLIWLQQTNLLQQVKSSLLVQKFIKDIDSGKVNIDNITIEDEEDYLY